MQDPDPNAPADRELVEWIDDHDAVVAVVTRSEMRRRNLPHRSCAVVVRSTGGDLLVHRRADTKDLHPGWWDVCAGGVLAVGEDALVGARRELAEELGLELPVERFRLLGTGRFDDERSRERSTVFEVTSDGPFEFADGEVAEARWVDPVTLDRLMDRHRFLPSCDGLILPLITGFEPPRRRERGAPPHDAYARGVTHIEFTIEPFVEGELGPHVTEAIAAVERLGFAVDVGPFGSSCSVPTARVGEVVAALSDAATARGATHVHLDVTTEDRRG